LHFWATGVTGLAGVVFDNSGFDAGSDHFFSFNWDRSRPKMPCKVPVLRLAPAAGTAASVRLAQCKAIRL
jgi:hypothetical protein